MDSSIVEKSEIVGELISNEWWEHHWREISKELDAVRHIWEDYYTKEFITVQVMSKAWQAWGFGEKGQIRLILLTQVVDFPANRFLQVIMALGNSLDQCLSVAEATLQRFAETMDCQMCEVAGRGAWERKLPGFHRRGVILTRRVTKYGVN